MLKITMQPTPEHRRQVLDWLRAHMQDGGGFYNNKDMIEQGFDEGCVHCAVDGEQAVAFGLFSRWTLSKGSQIAIMEVHPAHRRRGYGTLLARHLVQHLRSNGALAAYLECTPSESEPFWRSLGFVDYVDPNNGPGNKIQLQLALDGTV